jgi:uncharacterized damage-inducible protein DinB
LTLIKDELLKEFGKWINYLESIDTLNWNKPFEEDKWTIHDVVSHIYRWDKYFLEEAIVPITRDEPLTLNQLNFDEFNHKSIEIGKTQTKAEIINLSLRYRKAILDEIRKHDRSKFTREYIYGDGNKFVVDTYLRDFIWHDRHHIKQIEDRKNNL